MMARRRPRPSPDSALTATTFRPSPRRAASNAGHASRAACRSILFKTTTSGFSRSRGSWSRSSSRITSWSQPGSRAAPSTT